MADVRLVLVFVGESASSTASRAKKVSAAKEGVTRHSFLAEFSANDHPTYRATVLRNG